MIAHGGLLFAFPEREVWEGVMARGALDFGGQAPAKGVQMLSGVSIAAVRNAVSAGELPTNAEGFIEAEAARDWLSRRRDFCASRWRDTADDQYPFTPEKAVTSDAQGNILVPHDGDGVPFIPKYVARPTRGRTGLSFTVGAKGAGAASTQDFYEALHALAHMDVPRWRRRNSVGNWGIVRARGAWTAVSREDLQDQIAQTLSREG